MSVGQTASTLCLPISLYEVTIGRYFRCHGATR